MCSHLSKWQQGCSHAMAQAATESTEQNLDKTPHVKNVTHAYATKSEHSMQKVVYQVMPEIWLRKIFPAGFMQLVMLLRNVWKWC